MTQSRPMDGRRASDIRLRRQQEALIRLARSSVGASGDLNTALRLITEAAVEALDIERASVWQLSPAEGVLRCLDQFVRTAGTHSADMTLSMEQYPHYFEAIETEEVIAADNAVEHPHAQEFARGYLQQHNVASLLDAPVRIGGQTIGVLRCEHVEAGRTWPIEEQNFAIYLAHMVPLAMESSERRRAEESMERSHAVLMATLEATAEGVVATDREGRLTSFNNRFVEMWSIPDAKLSAVDATERTRFIGEQTTDPAGFLARFNEITDQPAAEAFEVLTLRDGRILELVSRPVLRGEEPVGRVWSYRDVTAQRKAEEALRMEREKSDRLLRDVLPTPIAERLKLAPSVIAEHFDCVSVLFADIVDFTQLASSIAPRELVEMLNSIFSSFDQLAQWHGVEKIKTIGDNYMAVAGVPVARDDHAFAIAEMALDMREALVEFCASYGTPLRIRIGIHSGPVVAGVIGIKRFTYDLWGSTVNTASRMESHGLAGMIQVSEETHALLGDRYVFQPRGPIEIKHMGPRPTWLLMERCPTSRIEPSAQSREDSITMRPTARR